ncbi:hypothetical protein HanRHA438_Chr06g0286221 [Helianthus annuus]|uniref:Uncharacterized protein n=1 Tax=Helianthus annuus TaxID=4232 RepID=A0A9K3IVJ2_HELAN|nr:hypothetical protein HanXRQr2_Chr06g0277111 [Helianthus annuus]KAJ0561819.1 hypothetical protein HanHA300_Chr06g0227341 [Helianthus annuus]KAJ0574884.1 hypothetical protein HanHA89_Chr06g0243311 [Helianthus annuus]KAJ0739214.1 hypothetical protein HanLR1_Chr06g0227361 [Helianthus annuus]KAJ0913490.1 hypothetical protein HanRHA438_Chr06g0286221 [Helianthus annuus]
MEPKVLLGRAFDHPDVAVCRLHAAASLQHCNTGDGVRAIHYCTKELLTRRQDYEISNGGFGRGQVKPLSDGIADKGAGEQTSYVDKWVDELAALRFRIEKALSDRLAVEPDNGVHMRLKRRYTEVLDVLPCWPAEQLETFKEGETLKRTTRGTSSPPSAPSGIRMVFYATQSGSVFFTHLV